MRAFVALDVGQKVRSALEELQRGLKRSLSDVRWVQPSKVHLTLKFLGEIDERLVESITPVLREVAASHSGFSLEVQGLGVFPNYSAARVVWVGVEHSRPLEELQRSVEEALCGVGLRREQRAYHPHLTIGRMRHPRGMHALRSIFEAHREVGSFRVSDIHLFQSQLTPSGAIYQKLSTAPLQIER